LFTNFFRWNKNRCTIPYIPKHLHQSNKPVIPDFKDAELLFWRLGKNPEQTPYSNISLFDVSCNRSGVAPNIISIEDDVLWNIEPGAQQEKYLSKVVSLIVRRIFPDNPPGKPVAAISTQGHPVSVIMKLIHNPLPCNYAHCMFVFEYNEVRVTKENYQSTFGAKLLKHLRKACKDELHKAILKNEIEI
jgi:hypothetical protein